jgi:hypothetical protein
MAQMRSIFFASQMQAMAVAMGVTKKVEPFPSPNISLPSEMVAFGRKDCKRSELIWLMPDSHTINISFNEDGISQLKNFEFNAHADPQKIKTFFHDFAKAFGKKVVCNDGVYSFGFGFDDVEKSKLPVFGEIKPTMIQRQEPVKMESVEVVLLRKEIVTQEAQIKQNQEGLTMAQTCLKRVTDDDIRKAKISDCIAKFTAKHDIAVKRIQEIKVEIAMFSLKEKEAKKSSENKVTDDMIAELVKKADSSDPVSPTYAERTATTIPVTAPVRSGSWGAMAEREAKEEKEAKEANLN